MTQANGPGRRFVYDHFEVDADRAELRCWYQVEDRTFEERVGFGHEVLWDAPAVAAAARIVFLLAGVSYYKTAAPPVIDLGTTVTTAAERAFLTTYYRRGLGEFAYRNSLDLSSLWVDGPDSGQLPPAPTPAVVDPSRPLIPFGGGIDSIVTVESVRSRFPDCSLFVVSRHGDRFAAIERPAACSGLPVVRAERRIDPQVLSSTEHGFLNGHVPVTGILSSLAVMAAVLGGHGAVVMSNEWSASHGNLEVGGQKVNHQWSKSSEFESGFRRLLSGALSPAPDYFSLLRPYSELWVARRFAALDHYHSAFRSCNRAFHLDPAQRLDEWCGICDKCCFIDLILAPYLAASRLAEIFDGAEPLRNPDLTGRFWSLLGAESMAKPFECVGDVDECRAAVQLASARPDRAGAPDTLLHELAAGAAIGPGTTGSPPLSSADLLAPLGEHYTPDAYSPEDQLV